MPTCGGRSDGGRAAAFVSRAALSGLSPEPDPRHAPEERPRQRLLRGGGAVLSGAEVLALVLGSGSRGVCPLGLARGVLEERGGWFGLVGVTAAGLRRRGLGEAKAASELERRQRRLVEELAELVLAGVASSADRSPGLSSVAFSGRPLCDGFPRLWLLVQGFPTGMI